MRDSARQIPRMLLHCSCALGFVLLTGLFKAARVGCSNSAPLTATQLFHEMDGLARYCAGVEARYFDRVVARALHYDNQADAAAFDTALHEFAWNTRFNGDSRSNGCVS